ncbi:MAG: hypothetical protein A2218_10440 [Elusimicrobia bacterium RIFOXYA2_FULL_53_38]|nr:MAG: hypothetical protein A2218_10440 [Elusimicrobia bacterium RIFOXYA2_FULL_53_38]
MKASEAKEGVRYLSKTGIPVTVTGTKNGKVLIKLETTKTTVAVNGDYDLKPIVAPAGKKEAERSPKEKGKAKADVKTVTAPNSLSALIDPMLLSGGHTVKEIAIELLNKAGEMAKGKDLEANVRARMVSYARKGWHIAKDDKKRVKVLQKKA